MTPLPPCLILLDCQRDQVEESDGMPRSENGAVIRHIAALLKHARANGWRVCHSQFAGDSGRSAQPPIDALRPTAKEAVFVRRGLSAFSDPYFHQVLARSAGAPVLLAGFSAPFSILATVFDAANRNQDMAVIPEAVGSLAVAPRSVSETRQLAFDLIDRIAPVRRWESLSDYGVGRTAAEPAPAV